MKSEAPPAKKKRKTVDEAPEAPAKKSKPTPNHPEPDDLKTEGVSNSESLLIYSPIFFAFILCTSF